MTKVSYLVARDPSILAYDRGCLPKINLNGVLLENESFSDSTNASLPEPTTLPVFLRIKNNIDPVTTDCKYEIENETILKCQFPENYRSSKDSTKSFKFTKIFPPASTQSQIFDRVLKDKILDFMNGRNHALLTYGASGAGKTYTMIGTTDDPGQVPRSLEYLFKSLPSINSVPRLKPEPNGSFTKLSIVKCEEEIKYKTDILNSSAFDKLLHNINYKKMQDRLSQESVATLEGAVDVQLSIWISFAEIYNEQIYDLLLPAVSNGQSRPRLRLGKIKDLSYIKNLKFINVSSGVEAYQIFQYGLLNLNFASTAVNSHSSRSHSIFTIRLVQSSKHGNPIVTDFHFCDLAGSERLIKTKNAGDRLKESNNINSSLLVFGRCVKSIRDMQNSRQNIMPPFRESKLTQLLEKSLAGEQTMSIMVNVNLSLDMLDDTYHVLMFSAIARSVTVQVPAAPKPNRFSMYMQANQQDLESLRAEHDLEVMDMQEIERQHRVNLMNDYKIIIKDMEVAQAKQLQAEKVRYAALEKRYRELLDEDVIEVDSSSDDDDDKEDEVAELRLQLSQKSELLAQKELILLDGVALVKELEAKIAELEAQLKDAQAQIKQEQSASVDEKMLDEELELNQLLRPDEMEAQPENTEKVSNGNEVEEEANLNLVDERNGSQVQVVSNGNEEQSQLDDAQN